MLNNLIIDQFGIFLGKHSERLVVRKGKETLSEHALMNLEQVIIASPGVSLSSDLIEECTERGIQLTFLTYSGRPYAKIVSPALTATVKTRREQLMAYRDERGVEITKRFTEGKIKNQINLLQYFGKYRKAKKPEVFSALQELVKKMKGVLKELVPVEETCIYEARVTLLNIEGRIGALYWQGVKAILPDGLFSTREHQGTNNPVNALLNYGYGILYSQIWTALTLAGLEPFGGFLHVDRPGKPSLVLDFIEEFRQPVVDRTVFGLINRGFAVEMEILNKEELAAQHAVSTSTESSSEESPSEQKRLSMETRKAFAQHILARLEDDEPFEGKRYKLKNIIQMQARHLATFLRKEGDYKPFVMRW